MKIAFTDFWAHCDIPGVGTCLGFNPNHNMLLDMVRVLRNDVEVVAPEHADVLFYSCYSQNHRRFSKDRVKKIFFTGENLRPNFNDCHYALSFDFDDYGGRNIRFPLWMMQIDWFGKKGYENPQYVFPVQYVDGPNPFKEKPKDLFASSVFNNHFPNRVSICKKLNEYKQTDIYGRPTGNWSYGEDRKLENISRYKFNICFENTDFPGYNTEKLIQARVAGCIPLYWGSTAVDRDFNPAAYLNMADFPSEDAFVEKIKQVDNDPAMASAILNAPLFADYTPKFESVLEKLNGIL